jgi:hypothetical protein
MVSAKYRRLCWLKYNGKKFNSKCYISWCDEKIDVYHFEAGHVLAEKHGGRDDVVENLRPICFYCNRDMKDKHMRDYDLSKCPLNKQEEVKKRYDMRRKKNPIMNEGYNKLEDESSESEDEDLSKDYPQEEMLKDIQNFEKELIELKEMYNQRYEKKEESNCCCIIS